MYGAPLLAAGEPRVRLLASDPSVGSFRLRLETPSDLWRVARFVRVGDTVGASTTRRDPEAPEDVPGAERSRRRVTLAVRAEQVEFHGFSKHVRVTGPIVEGPFDVGRHHTLDLTEGDDLTVVKGAVTAGDRALLDEGIAHRGDATLLVAAVDWGDSSIVRLRGRAIEPVADVRRTLAGKRFEPGQAEKDRASYVEELRITVVREAEAASALVLAGPGFLKEILARRIHETAPALAARLRIYPTAEAGRLGVSELLRSGRASEVLRQSVAAEEAETVERLVRAVASGTRAAVGPREVGEAIDAGAVEKLLVLESLLPEAPIAAVLDRARAGRAELFVVRTDEEAGRRLAGLGGIAALLRYDWTSPTAPRESPGRPRAAPRTDA